MPVHSTPGGGWQWGGHGKIYKGKGARRRAIEQGIAAHAHGYGKKSSRKKLYETRKP